MVRAEELYSRSVLDQRWSLALRILGSVLDRSKTSLIESRFTLARVKVCDSVFSLAGSRMHVSARVQNSSAI